MASADGHAQFHTDEEGDAALRACAEMLVDSLVLERMRKDVNREIVGAIKIGGTPRPRKDEGIGGNMLPSIEGSLQRVAAARESIAAEALQTRRQGLRPLQIWVPDVRAPEFIAEAHRQSVAIATSEREADDQTFVDAISSPWEDDDEEPSSR